MEITKSYITFTNKSPHPQLLNYKEKKIDKATNVIDG